jgi:hypothetical protein
MIDRLLYTLTALALLNVLAYDQNFSENLFRAFGGAVPSLPLDNWTLRVSGIFAALAAVALYHELRSR